MTQPLPSHSAYIIPKYTARMTLASMSIQGRTTPLSNVALKTYQMT